MNIVIKDMSGGQIAGLGFLILCASLSAVILVPMAIVVFGVFIVLCIAFGLLGLAVLKAIELAEFIYKVCKKKISERNKVYLRNE